MGRRRGSAGAGAKWSGRDAKWRAWQETAVPGGAGRRVARSSQGRREPQTRGRRRIPHGVASKAEALVAANRASHDLRNGYGSQCCKGAGIWLEVVDGMLHLARDVEVEKRGAAVFLQADLTGIGASAPPLRIDHTVVKNVRKFAAKSVGEHFDTSDAVVGRPAAAGDVVVVEVDVLNEGIVALVVGGEDLLRDGRRSGVGEGLIVDRSFVMNDVDVDGVVVLNFVVKGFDVANREDVHAGARRKIVNRPEALRREVGGIVVEQLIVEDADVAAALAREIRKIEDAHASGVVSGDVFVGVHVLGVLDFEAVDVGFNTVAAKDDVFGLTDINAGVGGAARDGVFDQ